MWGGRFGSAPDPRLRTLNDSLAFDWELVREDVLGSIAWAGALGAAGILAPKEASRIRKALREILDEVDGAPAPVDSGAEDVHSWVEARLRGKVGALAGKLHTGRSRNDQVATDLRLWLGNAIGEAHALVLALAGALADRAGREADALLPGYTHLKQAEPISFGHWCLAYAEMLLRDASRLRDAARRADECPLGSGALAGTPLPIDRTALARNLGFARPTANSLDAVSDRDAAAEYLFAASLLLTHLSRLAEDLIFFSSDEARLVELPDSLATGSSRMPQKKNPDVLELARGWSARSIGELAGFLALLKGLPLAYNKDLQLDKEPLFRTRRALAMLLPVTGAVIEGLELDRERMHAAAGADALMATELADALASRGMPFREAHEIVGRRFARAARERAGFRELPPADGITAADLAAATPERVAARKRTIGGTSPARVRRAAAAARKRIVSLAHAGRKARR
ncbi:MAG TPA: argininosuccinate lyase [Thermoanaerobaculia bacterium]|nr:argininosuccinate lyase [Thermoanaerobaculia bacterium]